MEEGKGRGNLRRWAGSVWKLSPQQDDTFPYLISAWHAVSECRHSVRRLETGNRRQYNHRRLK